MSGALLCVTGLHGKVLVAGAIGMIFVRSCEKLPPCLIKPVPAGSNTDLLLAKAKPIHNSGRASVITYLRGGKKLQWKQQSRERSETMWDKQLCRHQGQWRRRGRRCSRCLSRQFSLAACGEDHGEAGCPPAAHGGPRCSRYPPVAHGRDPTPEQVDAWSKLWPRGRDPARSSRPLERGAHTRAGLLAGLVTPWKGPTLEQPVPEGLHPVEGTHAGAVREELQPVGRTHIREVCGELSPVGGTSCRSRGESVRSPPPEEEGATEATCDELTATPIPHPSAPLRGKRERNRSEVEPGKKGEVGARCFKI